jgi:hypothetical protein
MEYDIRRLGTFKMPGFQSKAIHIIRTFYMYWSSQLGIGMTPNSTVAL